MRLGVGGEVFAAAEADFKPQIVGAIGKKSAGIVATGSESVELQTCGSSVSISPA